MFKTSRLWMSQRVRKPRRNRRVSLSNHLIRAILRILWTKSTLASWLRSTYPRPRGKRGRWAGLISSSIIAIIVRSNYSLIQKWTCLRISTRAEMWYKIWKRSINSSYWFFHRRYNILRRRWATHQLANWNCIIPQLCKYRRLSQQSMFSILTHSV